MIESQYGVNCLKIGFERYKNTNKLPISMDISQNTVSFYLKKPIEKDRKLARISNHHPSLQKIANKNQPWLSENISIEFIVPSSEEDLKTCKARVYQNSENSIKQFNITIYQYNSTLLEPQDLKNIFNALVNFFQGIGYNDPFKGTTKEAKVIPRHSNIKPRKQRLDCNISVNKNGNYISESINTSFKMIRLTETQFKRMLTECITKILKEIA